MLLTKLIKVKINKGNIPYYKSRFDKFKNTKIGDVIDIDIKHIPYTSKYKVNVKCDICGKEREILYSTYGESTKKETEIYTCRGKCTNIKRETTNMKLYGIKNCFQDTEKVKQGMMKNHGVDHNMKLEKCLNDRKETYIKNWGVDNPTKNEDIFRKSMKSGNKIKYYNNTNLFYQGTYEKDFLDKYFDKIKIENGLNIEYIYDNKNKVYHGDFYLPDYDLMVEIKSTYWYDRQKSKNILKELYSKKLHNFIMIMDKDYEVFNNLLL